ncbi:hypothetical protein CEXT_188801 [Caerostris extrusa]|uniref:Uncharacterized protein n=1 Tax=Caerostris extrusa TaxID=172846 RepID=A0AAV4NPA2_CAEEX|nr:hypothetical protein CEXT_188801 [Caerostris extrusa]
MRKILLKHPSSRTGSTPDKSVKKSSTSDECESGMTALRNARRSASLASRSSALSFSFSPRRRGRKYFKIILASGDLSNHALTVGLWILDLYV